MSIRTEDAPAYLASVENSGEDATIDAALVILKGRLKKVGQQFSTPRLVEKFIVLEMAELEHEVFGCLFLNNQHCLIESEILSTGTIDGASVYPREVLKRVLHHNAAAVIFYHNHPSGRCEPSMSDDAITSKLKTTLDLIDVRALDHIIVAGVETYSYADHGKI